MGSPFGEFLDGEAGFLREKLASGEIPTPAQLGDFLRSLTAKSGPLVREAPAAVATTMRDSLRGCGWDVGTNTSVGDDPPDPGVVLRALEETLAVLRASDSASGRRRSDDRGGRRSRSPPRRDRERQRERSRSPRRRRSRSRDRSRRRRSPSSSSSSRSRSRSRSPPKRRSGFSAQPPPGAAPELLAQSAMLQAMAGQGGISGGSGMPINPMMAMMGSMAGAMGGMSTTNILQNDKKMRELYVGNVPAGVTNEQLKEVLGGAMQQVGLNEQPGNPIVQCFMSGNFGFVEFRSASEASKGMNLDKIFIGNTHLNVGRPSKYTVGPDKHFHLSQSFPHTKLISRCGTGGRDALHDLGRVCHEQNQAEPGVGGQRHRHASDHVAKLFEPAGLVVHSGQPAGARSQRCAQISGRAGDEGAARALRLSTEQLHGSAADRVPHGTVPRARHLPAGHGTACALHTGQHGQELRIL